MCACKAPAISHLLLPPPLPYPNPKTQNLQSSICRAQLPNRRLFLFSVPLSAGVLLLPSLNSSYAVTSYDPVSPAERDASNELSQRVSEAVELLEKGRELQAQGDFNRALQYFSQKMILMCTRFGPVVSSYKELALTDYARVGRALALYEIGDREQAITEMEDVSISLKGYPEVHAALAAALYADKHAPLLAENQFAIATLLDPHYTDLSYVRESKHWPPSLIISLQHFFTLS
ncbi:Tetratricopeptide repeat protein [Quillaja saponaria]|uniref:Tetratricopeptide repeat protein n=1 Tax=Quillaja saponaria TaxID=32244 RepID=A0AAD7PIN0_QUISA|nr:Tetratricopeptide repeat protein [Quillaja saponaria]